MSRRGTLPNCYRRCASRQTLASPSTDKPTYAAVARGAACGSMEGYGAPGAGGYNGGNNFRGPQPAAGGRGNNSGRHGGFDQGYGHAGRGQFGGFDQGSGVAHGHPGFLDQDGWNTGRQQGGFDHGHDRGGMPHGPQGGFRDAGGNGGQFQGRYQGDFVGAGDQVYGVQQGGDNVPHHGWGTVSHGHHQHPGGSNHLGGPWHDGTFGGPGSYGANNLNNMNSGFGNGPVNQHATRFDPGYSDSLAQGRGGNRQRGRGKGRRGGGNQGGRGGRFQAAGRGDQAQNAKLSMQKQTSVEPVSLTSVPPNLKAKEIVGVSVASLTQSGLPSVAPIQQPVYLKPAGTTLQVGQTSKGEDMMDDDMNIDSVGDREHEGDNGAGNKERKDKDKWCFRCCTKGHVKEGCTSQLFCNICESEDHVAAKCPIKRKPRPMAYAVGYAVNDLGFYHIPHGPIDMSNQDGLMALIKVKGGQLTEQELIAHLKRLVPTKFEWEVKFHAPDTWTAPFPSM